MAEEGRVANQPKVYSIAAHRGFADALVAGLVPRYAEDGLGLARLTLLLPSSRARRTIAEAFIRHAGENGTPGLLMPRMAVVGDLDLDEALGPLLDPLGTSDIKPAIDPQRRMFALAALVAEEMGAEILKACVRMGGVLTGEHGVGVEKRDLMGEMFDETDLNHQQRLKCAFDADGRLNPGKVFPTLHRCAELGRLHVHHGEVPFPELPRF